jgi:hypothetical protein
VEKLEKTRLVRDAVRKEVDAFIAEQQKEKNR